jgi:Heparinase II/III-like protein
LYVSVPSSAISSALRRPATAGASLTAPDYAETVERHWRWYVARLGAMSSAEVAWRAGSTARRVVRPRGPKLTPPIWDDGWAELLRRLVETRRDGLIADAERIAAGELSFWGRRVEVDPRRVRDDQPLGPTEDRKPAWELNRQQHVFPLAAGAALAGRADWGRVAIDQLLDWIERGRWSSGYETAHRLVGWAWAVPLLEPTDDELRRISTAYARQAAYTQARPSLHSSANNHRLAELVGLLAASAAGVDLEWDALWAELEEQVVAQTYGDGGSREQAGGYFLYVFEILWVAAIFARARGRSLGRLEERLAAMLVWLQQVADAEGEPPPFGDDAEDRFLRVEYFERRRAAAVAGRVRALLDGEATLVPAALAAGTETTILPESGLAIFRSRGRRVAVDVGELGFGSLAAHGHADALSVVVDGVLRDSGTCAYAPPERREPYRATAAHNTVLVDGHSQAEPLGPHLWGRRFRTTLESHGPDHVVASHDGYRPARHTRSVRLLDRGVVVVLDRIAAPEPVEATLVWQLEPGAEAGAVAVVSSPSSTAAGADGPFSPRYTWCMEAPRSTWTTRGRDVVFASAIALEGSAPQIELTAAGVSVDGEELKL